MVSLSPSCDIVTRQKSSSSHELIKQTEFSIISTWTLKNHFAANYPVIWLQMSAPPPTLAPSLPLRLCSLKTKPALRQRSPLKYVCRNSICTNWYKTSHYRQRTVQDHDLHDRKRAVGGGAWAATVSWRGGGVYCMILLFERLLLDRYHSSLSAQSATGARAPSQVRDPFQADRAVTLVWLVPVNLWVSLEAPVWGEGSAHILWPELQRQGGHSSLVTPLLLHSLIRAVYGLHFPLPYRFIVLCWTVLVLTIQGALRDPPQD